MVRVCPPLCREWYLNGNYLVIIVSIAVILPLALMKQLGKCQIDGFQPLVFPSPAFKGDDIVFCVLAANFAILIKSPEPAFTM